MRVFAAIVPPDEVVVHLDEFLEVRRDHGDLRWADAGQFHVTLAFAANGSGDRVEEWAERLGESLSRRTPFEARLAGGGAFPHVASAKVLWCGVEASEALEGLAVKARNAANVVGVAVDGARFRQHLTIGRLRQPADVVRWVRLLDTYAGPTWTVGSVSLLQSHLGDGPGGRPRYELLADIPLAPSSM